MSTSDRQPCGVPIFVKGFTQRFALVVAVLVIVAAPLPAQDVLAVSRVVPAAELPADLSTPSAGEAMPAEAIHSEWVGGGQPWTNWTRLTGDWGHLRSDLARSGIDVAIAHTADLSTLVNDGSHRSAVARALTDLRVNASLEPLGLKGWTATVQYQHKGGADGADCVDAAQGFSNIDAANFSGMAEAWIEGELIPDRLRVKVGRVDANSEFAAAENGHLFLNSAMGFSPAIFAMPTYPYPAMSANVIARPHPRVDVAFGIYNGRPAVGLEGWGAPFIIQQAGFSWNGREGRGGGRVAVGAWRHPGPFGAIAADRASSASGRYVTLDQTLTVGKTAAGATRSLGFFGQYADADTDVAPVARHLGAGVVASGIVSGRERDAIGVAVTSARLAPDPDRASDGSETTIDTFYRVALARWMAAIWDMQVIRALRGVGGAPAHIVGTLRLSVAF
jgi:porin